MSQMRLSVPQAMNTKETNEKTTEILQHNSFAIKTAK